jgi:segregation and condensation protein A
MHDAAVAVVPEQLELPLAYVHGEPYTEVPQDLYIPPDALEVFLEAFEGPLDLLLYLIKKQNLDILDIPIAEITRQYMSYIEMMENMRLELAAEYLVMAAMLAEIKSRLLLPRPVEEVDAPDPRADLVRRLQEYERYKQAGEDLDKLPRVERDLYLVQPEIPKDETAKPLPSVNLQDLVSALQAVMARAQLFEKHHIQRDAISVRERMSSILTRVSDAAFIEFSELLYLHEGRHGVVVSFMAILELVKESLLELVQNEPFAPIYVRAPGEHSLASAILREDL